MKKIFLILMLVFIASEGFASSEKEVCFKKTLEYEKKENIRPYILSTIAMVESGRGDKEDTLGIYPWPWTVMAEGKGMFFKNKESAIVKVKELQERGVTNIDVGCMQVNIFYHGENFASLEDMFEPDNNVAYAASFVKKLYKESNRWDKAATAYHSKTTKKAERYEEKLIAAFKKIKDYVLLGNKLVKEEQKIITVNSGQRQNKKEISVNKDSKTFALMTPNVREKISSSKNSALIQSSFDASLYRERKKNEYDLRKQQRNNKEYK